MALSTIELCSGVGMLGEGLRAGLRFVGIETRTVCHVEREAYAASVVVARMEEGSLDAAPVWPDLCTFDARAWSGKVDCVVAGFPCQDLSVAGKRAGLGGKRSGLFFEVVRIAADCGAWLMLLENVAGIASATATALDEAEGELEERAASRVVGELADCGWSAEWITISASDVGASHGRARWFCLAWKLDDARRMQRRAGYEQDRPGSTKTSGYEADHRATDRSINVDDAERSERRPSRSGSAGSQQGNDGGRSETHGRTGVADEVLGDAGLQHGELQQRRVRPEHQGAGNELAIASRIGRGQGRAESGGQQRRLDADERGVSVADASRPRQQRPEFGISCDGNRGGAGNTWIN